MKVKKSCVYIRIPMTSRRLLLSTVLPLAVAGLGWSGWHAYTTSASSNSAEPYALLSEEVALLQEGDIILRRGSGMVSDIIARLLNEKYELSHCGIVVELQDELWVVHSVSNSVSEVDGMQVHRLQDFVGQSLPNSVVVSRLHTIQDGTRIAEKAIQYLQREVPFDHHFDLRDTSAFYCSELIWRIILDEYGLDIFKDALDAEKGYYHLSNFLDPECFEVVLDHQQR
jgi:hypothetical protein